LKKNRHHEIVVEIAEHEEFGKLSAWEKQFIHSMIAKFNADHDYRVSSKELSVIQAIELDIRFHESCSKPD
jgi:hypothetical protein